MQIPYILQPLLKYKAIELENEQMTTNRLRRDLCNALRNLDDRDFRELCNHVTSLQHFRYRLNNTLGCESLEEIPEGQKHLFAREEFNPTGSAGVTLPESEKTCNDPGIIIQKCLKANDPKSKLIEKVAAMPFSEFKRFFTQIACLEYFASLQDGSYFTRHTELFSEDDERFWFIDDDFLTRQEDLPNIM